MRAYMTVWATMNRPICAICLQFISKIYFQFAQRLNACALHAKCVGFACDFICSALTLLKSNGGVAGGDNILSSLSILFSIFICFPWICFTFNSRINVFHFNFHLNPVCDLVNCLWRIFFFSSNFRIFGINVRRNFSVQMQFASSMLRDYF